MVQLLHQNQSSNRIHTDLKVPPHSVEAEQAVLGGLMLSDAAWDVVADIVKEDDFYQQRHRLIFRSIAAVAALGQERDIVTLSQWMEPRGMLEKIEGGMMYLGALAKDTPSAANIKAYAEIVKERSLLRQLIKVGEEIASNAFSPGNRELKELIEEAQSAVLAISAVTVSKPLSKIKNIMSRVIDMVDERFMRHEANENSIIGVSTGFDALDELTLGMEPKDLWVLAARPSMGKSTLAFNIAEHVSAKLKLPVLAFSMEMGEDQVGLRTLASIGGLSGYCMRKGIMGDEDWPKITAAVSVLSEAELYIDDRPALTISQIRARCREFKRQHGLCVVIVDYIQLMRSEYHDSRANEVAEFTRGLKAIAKELDVRMIALSQLNRSLEQRPNKRPQMSDLRESGAIEQDADIIMFIYRDEVYNEHSPDKGTAEIICAKQRNGPTGMRRLTTKLHQFKFLNYAPEQSEHGEPTAAASNYANKGAPD